MENVKKQLLEVSDIYGKSLSDVSEAYYLALQNQVGNSAESLNVMTEAAKISVATNTDLSTSVDTLTVAINGFKLGADSAGEVAGKLFKATEIGRFQFRDMSDTMGRVNSIAESLGISLSEVLGPISTMTRQGVRFDTAVTQMRATMSQLLKPTERMKEIFKGWGVEDVQQAMSKFGGLHPMLIALEEVLKGNSSAMAEAFTNLRAFTGVMSILGRNADEVAEDIRKISEAGQEVADAVYVSVAKTEGQKLAESWNKIANNFIRLGEKLLPLVNAFATLATWVTDIVQKLGPTGMGAVLGVTAALLKANIAAAWGWATSFAGVEIAVQGLLKLFPVLAAFIVGWKLGEIVSDWIDTLRGFSKEADNLHRDLLKKEQEYTDSAVKAASTRFDAVNKEVAGMKNVLTSYLSEAQKIHDQITEHVLQANGVMVDSLKTELEDILDDQEKLVGKIRDIATNGGQAMLDARKNYTQASQALSDKEFGFRVSGYDNVQKAHAEMQRSQQMMNAALSKFRAAKLPEDIQAAKDELAAAAKYAESATASAGTEAKNRSLLTSARQNELRIAKTLVDMEAQRIRLIQQQAATAARTYQVETNRYKKMKSAVQDILEGYSKTTGEGENKQLKSVEQMVADTAKAEDAWGRLMGAMTEGREVDPMKLLGLVDLRSKLDAAAGKLPALKAQVTFEYKQQFAELTEAFNLLPKEIRIAFPDLDKIRPITDLMNRLSSRANEFGELREDVAKFDGALQSLKNTVAGRLDPFKDMIPNQNILAQPTTNMNEMAQAYHRVLQSVQALRVADPSNVDAYSQAITDAKQNIAALQTQMKEHPWQTALGMDATTVTSFKNAVDTIGQSFYGTIKNADPKILQSVQQAKKIADEFRGIAGAFDIDIDITNLTALSTAWQASATNSGTINTNTEATNIAMTGVASKTGTAATNMERMAEASKNIKSPTILDEFAKGGVARFAAGGNVFKPHGTDKIPAMLSEGEFVVNAGATRRFFSQLVAMNAGVKPVYRQDGGAVTNIGDINVSVNGSSSTRQTAREIATALRREVRRGTSKL